ncbi:hypothetical protein MHB71_26110 [Paenibacillus sp. FSL H7-0940]|uniref:hypothetical protein n=1 Tax=Paenibacillus sp. FSL H7-0940 TaxID=2921443 RepID=UPI0030EB5BB4
MSKINWDLYGKWLLPVIIPVLAIIIFNTFNFFIKSTVTLAEESYGLGYKLGNFLDKFF